MKEKLKNYIIYFKDEMKKSIKEIKDPKTFHRQIPNLLTSSRLFSPAVILPLFFTGNNIAVVLAVAGFGLTDLFDGKLARKFNSTSKFGKDLDAIVDKVFVFTLLLPLLLTNSIISITILLEAIIAVTNVKSELKKFDVYSTKTGKFKTFFIYSTITLGYASIFNNYFSLIYYLGILSTNLIQIKTATEYIINYKKQNDKNYKLNPNIDQDNNINSNVNDKEKNNVNSINFDIKNNIPNEINNNQKKEKDFQNQMAELKRYKVDLIEDNYQNEYNDLATKNNTIENGKVKIKNKF
ncbi:MAG TPA: CDP-alcohol phosphatidyltransferase family protein [Tenericutes bacterium]|nr:CDP-alcohol phosphatidyltransferase family protein [Mycoplasmatota bacterium]